MKYIFLLTALLSFSTQTYAQTKVYNSLTIPAELTENANEVVRLDYMNFVIQSPKSATLHVKYIVTLLNDKSNAYSQYVSYDKHSKVSNLSAKIYDATGKEVRKIKSKEFVDQSAISSFSIYEDDRVKSIDLHHSSFPYTIEIAYSKTFKGLLYYPSSYLQSYYKSIENFEFIVEAPNDLKIRHQSQNIDLEPQIHPKKNKTVYTWTAKSLPALELEPYAPYHEKIRPAIKIAPTLFQYDNYKGDMSSWESLVSLFMTLTKTEMNSAQR